MSDTPETDAEAITPSGFEADDVPAEFARKLERERDDARDAFVIATDQMVQSQCKLREVNTELDEAIDVLMRIEEIFVDGENTHDDWFKMGSIAREYFKK